MNISNYLKSINWVRAKGHYVIVDPINSSGLLYLSENRYQKLVAIALSNDREMVVLVTPEETQEEVYMKFSVKPDGSTPPIQDLRAKFSSMFTLRSGWVVKDSLIRFKRNFKAFLPTYYRDVRNWLGLKNPLFCVPAIQSMGLKLNHFYSHSNINFIILYLKVASIATLQYLAGNPLKSTQALGKRISLSNGLPKIIPFQLRKLIREGDIKTIIVVSTILHSFKGMLGVGQQPSLGSIQAPHVHATYSHSTWRMRSEAPVWSPNFEPGWFNDYDPNDETRPTPAERLTWPMLRDEILKSRSTPKRAELDKNIVGFWKFFNRKSILPDLLFSFPTFPLIMTAGPSDATSILGSGIDAMVIARNKQVREVFEDYINTANEVQVFQGKPRVSEDADLLSHIETVGNSYYSKIILRSAYHDDLVALRNKAEKISHFRWNSSIAVLANIDILLSMWPRGKLAFKHEAAGKVRVFALGDYWSQVLLTPLHDSLFRVLKAHPCDATFDQLGKVKEFTERRYRFVASYDLKSATDLIPVHLYEDVLAQWTSRAFAGVWLEVLTSRKYWVPESRALATRQVEYTRGQPMGLLSSWASLAMVHHYLVYLAAARANEFHFEDYLVLGDDIIIAHPAVAHHYTKVCEEYGITIGLAKSFVSNTGFFQFASQNIYNGHNISPLSLKEVLMVSANSLYFGPSTSLSAKVEWIRRLRDRGFIGNTISSSVRAITTHSEWRKLTSKLTKGIIPSDRLNTIVSILVSELSSYTNTYQVDTLLAAMKGEYGIFTGTFKEDALTRYSYLKATFSHVKMSLVGLLVKAKHASNEALWDSYAMRVKQVRELIPEVLYSVEPAINEIVDAHAAKFAEILKEFRIVEGRLEETNTLEYWTILYQGPKEGRIEFSIEDIVRAFSLVEKARSLVLEKTLYLGAIHRIKNVPRLAILHRSLLAKLRLSQ